LTPESFEQLLDDLVAGKKVNPGPQNDRFTSEPEGGANTLIEKALYSKVKAKALPNAIKKTRKRATAKKTTAKKSTTKKKVKS
jgi:NADH-quinone oxidoreductase subunit E